MQPSGEPMGIEAAASPGAGEELELRRAAEQVERLLDELREMTVPPAMLRVEQLLRTLTRLYGAALDALLLQAQAIASSSSEAEATLIERIARQEPLASLLALHGLHPLTVEERLARALAAVGDEVTLLGFEAGVARVQIDPGAGRASREPTELARILEQALRAAAPEVEQVRIEGLAAPGGGRLVSIDLRRSRVAGAGGQP